MSAEWAAGDEQPILPTSTNPCITRAAGTQGVNNMLTTSSGEVAVIPPLMENQNPSSVNIADTYKSFVIGVSSGHSEFHFALWNWEKKKYIRKFDILGRKYTS
jgi:hypothetical protein